MHMENAHAGLGAAELAAAYEAADATVEHHAAPPSALPAACVAARDGDGDTLRRLVAEERWAPLDLTSRDAHGYRAHHWAAGSLQGCLDVCLELCEAQSIDALTLLERREGKRGGRSLLHWAARNGIEQHARLLVPTTHPEARAADDTTPLMLALYGGHVKVCDVLRGAGASVCELVNDFQCGDAHWAAMGLAPVFALQWLQRFASAAAWRTALAATQAHGHSCFHKLAQRGHSDAARWLADAFRAADFSAADAKKALGPDTSGRRPSQIAKCAGFDDCAGILEQTEANALGPSPS
ncbi:hypothetical protein M885DRAFT_550321 [Pelagophyceae sp. CCMP2097]|nr:hypothetical protein M885DRAFT_550321 [Pelagophyceae sp. CCMP2097]